MSAIMKSFGPPGNNFEDNICDHKDHETANAATEHSIQAEALKVLLEL